MVEALFGEGRDDLAALDVGQAGDVDVAGAGVAAGRAGRARPAGDLERLEAGAGGPVGDLDAAACRGRGR